MPSLITHTAIGVGAGLALADGTMPLRFYALSIVCAILPDADVLAFFLKIPYGHVLGHRGFCHSLTFAALAAIAVVVIFFPHNKGSSWFLFAGYFFALIALHDLLDAFTNGGLGIALLSPFDNHRYFFSFRPILVSPLSPAAFFSEWGLRVVVSEFLWVWVPVFAVLAALRVIFGPFMSMRH
jgi:inner membrane protein